jgi:uncharacterized DUF497 family protein
MFFFYTFLLRLGAVQFEFDPSKSASNVAKHGIDFNDAQALWDDENYLEIQARTKDEPRWLVIGKIDGRTFAAIVTKRQGVVRIVSVRRARVAEETWYESP